MYEDLYWILYHIKATTASSIASANASSSSSDDTYTTKLVAVIVVSSVYGLVMIVLVGTYHLFIQPFSGVVGHGAGVGKKRVPAKDMVTAPNAVRS